MSQCNPEHPSQPAGELRAANAEAKRPDLRSRFIATANHDLRQPLQTICFIQGMLARSVSDPAARKLIEQLDQAVVSMSEILDRLTEMDREEPTNSTSDSSQAEYPMQASLESPASLPSAVIRASETPQSD